MAGQHYFWLNGAGEKHNDSAPWLYRLTEREAIEEGILRPGDLVIPGKELFLCSLPRIGALNGGGWGGAIEDLLARGDLLIRGEIVTHRRSKD